MRIAGHSSITISSRYVHPAEDTVLAAVERLGGHKTGHSLEHASSSEKQAAEGEAVTAEGYMVSAAGFESALKQQTKNLTEHSWQS